jgi:hypothetical protein
MDQRPRIPRFGVPEKISSRDVGFVVVAGIGLTIVLVAILSFAVRDFDSGNPVHLLLVLGVFGLGPALAYYLARWLRASRISLPVGCGALVLWAVILAASALLGGWLGVGICAVFTGLVMWRIQGSRGRQEPAPM